MRNKGLLTLLTILFLALLAFGYRLVGTASVSAVINSAEDGTTPIEARLESGAGLYVINIDARMAEDVPGDLWVSLEGTPGMNYSVVRFAQLLHPNTPRDPQRRGHLLGPPDANSQLSFWLFMQPKPPVSFQLAEGAAIPACCATAGRFAGSSLVAAEDWGKPLQLTFREGTSGRSLFSIPIRFDNQKTALTENRQAATEELRRLFVTSPVTHPH